MRYSHFLSYQNNPYYIKKIFEGQWCCDTDFDYYVLAVAFIVIPLQ